MRSIFIFFFPQAPFAVRRELTVSSVYEQGNLLDDCSEQAIDAIIDKYANLNSRVTAAMLDDATAESEVISKCVTKSLEAAGEQSVQSLSASIKVEYDSVVKYDGDIGIQSSSVGGKNEAFGYVMKEYQALRQDHQRWSSPLPDQQKNKWERCNASEGSVAFDYKSNPWVFGCNAQRGCNMDQFNLNWNSAKESAQRNYNGQLSYFQSAQPLCEQATKTLEGTILKLQGIDAQAEYKWNSGYGNDVISLNTSRYNEVCGMIQGPYRNKCNAYNNWLESTKEADILNKLLVANCSVNKAHLLRVGDWYWFGCSEWNVDRIETWNDQMVWSFYWPRAQCPEHEFSFMFDYQIQSGGDRLDPNHIVSLPSWKVETTTDACQ